MDEQVLVVDEDPVTLNLARITLEPEGYHVDTLCGEPLLQRLAAPPVPFLILLNEQHEDALGLLPVLHGLRSSSHLPGVFLLYSNPEEAKSLGNRLPFALPVDRFFCKPVGPRELLAYVKRLRQDVDKEQSIDRLYAELDEDSEASFLFHLRQGEFDVARFHRIRDLIDSIHVREGEGFSGRFVALGHYIPNSIAKNRLRFEEQGGDVKVLDEAIQTIIADLCRVMGVP